MYLKHLAPYAISLVLAIAHILILYYNITYVRFPPHKNADQRFGGKYEYLTVLNLIFLTGSLVFNCICDFLPKVSGVQPLHQLKGVVTAASATISLFVCLSFWTLYAINRELVFPAKLDSIIPLWHNHAIHTTILPASVLSYVLTPKGHAPRLATLMATASCLVVAYTVWIHVIYHNTGRWVYPVLAVLSGPARVLFIAACALSTAPFAYAVHTFKAWADGRQFSAAKVAKRNRRQQKTKARKAN